jgi:hypothetical protein
MYLTTHFIAPANKARYGRGRENIFFSYEPRHFAGETTRPEKHNLDKVTGHDASSLMMLQGASFGNFRFDS